MLLDLMRDDYSCGIRPAFGYGGQFLDDQVQIGQGGVNQVLDEFQQFMLALTPLNIDESTTESNLQQPAAGSPADQPLLPQESPVSNQSESPDFFIAQMPPPFEEVIDEVQVPIVDTPVMVYTNTPATITTFNSEHHPSVPLPSVETPQFQNELLQTVSMILPHVVPTPPPTASNWANLSPEQQAFSLAHHAMAQAISQVINVVANQLDGSESEFSDTVYLDSDNENQMLSDTDQESQVQ